MTSQLENIFGKENVLTDPASLIAYSTDASQIKGSANSVVFPKDSESVRRLIVYANRVGIPLVARGGGTSLVGSAVPDDAIVVDFSKMTKMSDFDKRDNTVWVEPGVILERLNDYFKKHNLFFPVIPSSHTVCTIGGMIATDAAGIRAMRYGKTSDNVIELEYFDGTGKHFKSADPNIFGTEGILGIVVRAKLKLRDIPSTITLDFMESNNLDDIMDTMDSLNENPNVSALDFLDKKTSKQIGLSEKYHLIVEFEDDTGNIKDSDEIKQIWKTREGLYTIQEKEGYRILEDPIMPNHILKEFIEWCEEKEIPVFGHIGNGLIHLEFKNGQDALIKEMQHKVKELGGEVSGEHGIGVCKKEFLNDDVIDAFKSLKKKYDPLKILNPGKIIDRWRAIERYDNVK